MRSYSPTLVLLFDFYSIGFLGATFNHSRDLLLGGFLPYRHAPMFYNLFWTSLTFIDPLVPILFLLNRPYSAMLLAVLIMVADVAANSLFTAYYLNADFLGNVNWQAQTAFLAFVLITVPFAWRTLRRRHVAVAV